MAPAAEGHSSRRRRRAHEEGNAQRSRTRGEGGPQGKPAPEVAPSSSVGAVKSEHAAEEEHSRRHQNAGRNDPDTSKTRDGQGHDIGERRRRKGRRRKPPAEATSPSMLQSVMESPRLLPPELLHSPPPSAERGADVLSPTSYGANILSLLQTPTKITKPAAISKTPSPQQSPKPLLKKEEILRRAAERALEKKQERAKSISAGIPVDTGDQAAGHDADGFDYVIDESGAFKLVPNRSACNDERREMEEAMGVGAEGNLAAVAPTRNFKKGGSNWAAARGTATGEGGPNHWDLVRDAHFNHNSGEPPADTNEGDGDVAEEEVFGPQPPEGSVRRVCFYISQSKMFSVLVLVTILFTAIFEAMQSPRRDTDEWKQIFKVGEVIFNIIFTIEFFIKVLALGCCGTPYAYFQSGWNVVDFLIVILGWLLVILEQFIKQLRTIKLLRLVRVLRPLTVIPSLRNILNSMLAAARSLGNNMLIILFFLFLLGIFGVSMLSGKLRYRCYDLVSHEYFEPKGIVCSPSTYIGRQCDVISTGRANASCEDSGVGPYAQLSDQRPYFAVEWGTGNATWFANPDYGCVSFDYTHWAFLQIFQVWAGVGWTYIMYKVVDTSGSFYNYVFTTVHLLGSWFLINLMVAVLGESYQREQARVSADRERRRKHDAAVAAAEAERTRTTRFRARLLAARVLSRWRDYRTAHFLTEHLESPPSGSRVEQAAACQHCRLLIVRQRALVLVESLPFRVFIMSVIVGNTIATAVDGPYVTESYGLGRTAALLVTLNVVFGSIFTMECVVKLFAFGFHAYFIVPLNVLDATTVVLFLFEQALATYLPAGGELTEVFNVMKVARLLRIFKLARSIVALRVLLIKMGKAMTTVFPMTIILFFLLFVVSVIAMNLFASAFDDMSTDPELGPCDTDSLESLSSSACALKPRYHYDDFFFAFMTIFQVMTCDNWPWLMWGTYNVAGGLALFFYPTVIIIGNFVVLNLFLAVLLANFSSDKMNTRDKMNKNVDGGEEAISPEKPKEGEQKRSVAERYAHLPSCIRAPLLWFMGENERLNELKAKAKAARDAEKSKQLRKQNRSLMRQRKTKYAALNGWEIAHLKRVFAKNDIDGDGYLTLQEIHDVVEKLSESPGSLSTWQLLDDNAERDDLITLHEFLVFISIKRSEDDTSSGQPSQARADAQKQMPSRLRLRTRRRRGLFGVLRRMAHWVVQKSHKVIVEKLPPLGVFARDALGENLARSIQHKIFSRGYWVWEVAVVVISSMLLTLEIDAMVYETRLNAGASTVSDKNSTPEAAIVFFDAAFLITTAFTITMKVVTQGSGFFSSGWARLDAFVLFFSLLKLFIPEYKRSLLSLSALRVFMLLPRIRELKKLSESILYALPNMIVTLASCMVIWIMFAITGVVLFGGKTSSCVILADAAGVPGCGIDQGSLSYSSVTACRYVTAPMAVPPGVVPGVTNSTECGCVQIDGVFTGTCNVIERDGVELAWLPAFPNFDETGSGMLALFQVATLDGWSNLLYFSMDGVGVGVQPRREFSMFFPFMFFVFFIVIGVLFITNIFVGVVIDEFQRIKRFYEGSAFLTEEQQHWLDTQKLILRLKPHVLQVSEPDADHPHRRRCFRLIYDADEHGLPHNAPEDAIYYGNRFEQGVAIAICLNIIVLCLWSDPVSPEVMVLYEVLNMVFVIVFAVEAALKISAYTFRHYIHSYWNRFDFFLVVFSLFATVVIYSFGDVLDTGVLRFLRSVRALRILRLSQVSPGLLKMVRTLIFATPSICNILCVILLFTFAYAQMGMTMLGTLIYDANGSGFSRHSNFETFSSALFSLMRMATGDAWSVQLADALHNPHVRDVSPPPYGLVLLYMIGYMAFVGWVLISISVAIILDYFNESTAEEGMRISFEHIDEFLHKWSEFDVNATHFINTLDLGLMLATCGPPLVAVKERQRDGMFQSGGDWVKPSVEQLDDLIAGLDVPEHSSQLHFLEVVLCLLQRLTGVVGEEQLMAALLKQHPKYLSSIRNMGPITGFTSDAFVREAIMRHLHSALEATGVSADLFVNAHSYEHSCPVGASPSASRKQTPNQATSSPGLAMAARRLRRCSLTPGAGASGMETRTPPFYGDPSGDGETLEC